MFTCLKSETLFIWFYLDNTVLRDGWVYPKSCETLNDQFVWTSSSISLEDSRVNAMESINDNGEKYIVGGIGQTSIELITSSGTIRSDYLDIW